MKQDRLELFRKEIFLDAFFFDSPRRARLLRYLYQTNLLLKLTKLSNRTKAVARLILNGRIYQRHS